MKDPINLKHGVTSKEVRRRYSDKRTEEGKRLAAVRSGLVDSIGGPDCVTTAQSLILAAIEAKLIIVWQIANYVDRQETIVDTQTSEILPCLNKTFLSYSESLRRDIVTLYGLSRLQVRIERLPKIEDLIKANVDGAE